MRKSLVLIGFALFIIGIALGSCSSQRNCLIAFITEGYMSFWTAMELGGFMALAGIIIVLIGFVKKT